MIRALLTLSLLLFFAVPSHAADSSTSPALQTTSAFLAWCNGASESDPISQFKEIHCLGYLDGVLDTASMMLSGLKPESRFICPPAEGIEVRALLKIVNEYVIKNPKTLTETARMTIFIAYGKAFPCN